MRDIGIEGVNHLWPEIAALPSFAREALEADALYAGYLDRQSADISMLRKEEALTLPESLDYAAMPSLSTELKLKLARVKPQTLGHAARIEGMTPAALAALLGHVKRREIRPAA
ncbi:MAG: hypothetical protein HC767_04165 [Akkermansiaceae bacterium]|nr:hypothetical protein [Akkermansiaceae bacterium]